MRRVRSPAVARVAATALALLASLSPRAGRAHPPLGIAPPPPAATPHRAPPTAVTSWLDDVRAFLQAQHLDGWLLTDARGQDPIAAELVRPRQPLERWFYLIPATGEPQLLVHADDAAAFDARRPLVWHGWRDLDAGLKQLLRGRRRVAMETSTRLPALSLVDAGTVERVRAAGAQVVSSADLCTLVRARLSDAELAAHQAAARALVAVEDDAFAFIAHGAGRVTEYDVQQHVEHALAARGLAWSDPPVVAAGVHTADPRFVTTPERSERIRPGDLVTLSLAARLPGPDGVYADQTWVAFVGDQLPDEVARLWAIARDARARVLQLLGERLKKRQPLRAFELDDAARAVAVKAGFGDRYLGPTGHSLGAERFGAGPDLDDTRVRDDRLVLPRTAFTVEPGLFVAGAMGLRAGADVFLGPSGLVTTPTPLQTEVHLIR